MLMTKRKPVTVGEILVEEFMQPMGLTQGRPARPGWLHWAVAHSDFDFGVQVVSGRLMDGNADPKRIQILDLGTYDDKPLRIPVIPIEDLIADRLSQAYSSAKVDEAMRNQAVRLYQFAEGLDEQYLAACRT